MVETESEWTAARSSTGIEPEGAPVKPGVGLAGDFPPCHRTLRELRTRCGGDRIAVDGSGTRAAWHCAAGESLTNYPALAARTGHPRE